jgi:GNAT superfamily N-acetyltransferase
MQAQNLQLLSPASYQRVIPLFEGYIRDPLMYATLEGQRGGKVFVDDPGFPTTAVVWTETECLYVACQAEDKTTLANLQQVIESQLLSEAVDLDMDFVSIFTYPPSLARKLERQFSAHHPLRTPIDTFQFNQQLYQDARPNLLKVPDGMVLRRLDRELLEDTENETLLDAVLHYWGTLEAFLANSAGYALQDDGRLVSWLYVQAYGAGGQAPDAWTDPDYRGRGLGSLVGAQWIEDCLARGDQPFWINDEANLASRRLAERLGFEFVQNLDLVDVPFYPFQFYRGMARHFFLINDKYRSAAEAFERAFKLGEADPSDYYLAAASWMQAGEPERAMQNLRRAVDHGLEDLLALEGTDAFESLRGTEQWTALINQYLKRRKN